jgi:hypothetical protein
MLRAFAASWNRENSPDYDQFEQVDGILDSVNLGRRPVKLSDANVSGELRR